MSSRNFKGDRSNDSHEPRRPTSDRALAIRFDRKALLGGAAIIVATLLLYLPAIRGSFIWDDPEHVVENPTLRSLTGLIDIWTKPSSLPQWYPLVHTTFWIEFHLWRLAPLGYHLDNVLLHIAASLLLWRILLKLQVPGGWLAAMLFAVHPVQVESVAWITERKNTLSTVFYFLALLAFVRFDRDRKRSDYMLMAGLFICALLSKSVTATFPAAVLVIAWWKRGMIRWRQDVLPMLPLLLIGAASGLLTAYIEAHHVGATPERIAELRFSPADRVLIAGRVIWFYAAKLIWPHPLSFVYPRWTIDAHIWWQWVFPIAALAVLGAFYALRSRIGRGPAAAAMLFCGTLFPALGFFNVYPMRFSFVADHFQYLAAAAMFAPIAAALCRWTGRWGRVVLLPLAVITVLRTPVFADAETLWRDTLSKNANSWMVHTNLANVLRARAEQNQDSAAMREADEHYFEALRLNSKIHETHTQVGMIYARRGEYRSALQEFERALQLNPKFTPAMVGMGRVYEKLGDPTRAATEYRRAIDVYAQHGEAHWRLGKLLESQQDWSGAAEHLRIAAAQSPDDADILIDLAICYARLRQPAEFERAIELARAIDPNNPRLRALLNAKP